MIKMTRTAVIPKLLDPNLVYQVYFFNLEKCQWIYKKDNQNNIPNDQNWVQRTTYY